MKRSYVVRVVVFVLLCLVLVAPVSAQPTYAQPKVSAKVERALATTGEAQVVIALRDPVAVSAKDEDRARAVAGTQALILAQLSPDEFKLHYRYGYVPALAGTITPKALAILMANSAVVAIQPDEQGSGHLGESVPALGANLVHTTLGITGQGVRVAVIDSGIDTDHPDLSDDIVAQHCFTHANCAPGNTDEGGIAEDQNGHGTNVASVITSKGVVASVGFAPDAEIVAIRVLDNQNTGWLSDWVAALDWVRGQPGLSIKIVNMSLGTYVLSSGNCDADLPTVADAISLLNAQGVTVFASSGNAGSATALSSPACNSNVIAVGATYDANLGREPDTGTYATLFNTSWPACFDAATGLNTVTCFTNSNAMLDIVAPGAWITGSGMGGGLSTYIGTSQASPTAAGVAALMLQANANLTPGQVELLLKSTGVLVTDPKNGRQFPRINALAAVQAVLALVVPTPTPTATPTVTPTPAPRQVTGRVDLQARSNAAGTQVTLGPWTTTTLADGTFSLMALPGAYTASAGHSGYLGSQTAVNVSAVSPSTVLPSVLLMGGDANANGQVDLTDLVLVAANYGQSAPPGDTRADINADGIIGLYDLILVGANYGLEGNQPWSAKAAARKSDPAKRATPRVLVDAPDKVAAGEEFTAIIHTASPTSVWGADLQLAFDPTRLLLTNAQAGAWLDPVHSFIARNQVTAPGRYQFAATQLGDVQAPPMDTVVTLRFRALTDAAPDITVTHAEVASKPDAP